MARPSSKSRVKRGRVSLLPQMSLQCSEVTNTLETQVPEVFHTSDPSTNVTDNSPDGPTVMWLLPTMEEPSFIWGNIQGEDFKVNQAYEEVVHWLCHRAGTPISGLCRWFKPRKCSNESMYSGTDITTTEAKQNQQE